MASLGSNRSVAPAARGKPGFVEEVRWGGAGSDLPRGNEVELARCTAAPYVSLPFHYQEEKRS